MSKDIVRVKARRRQRFNGEIMIPGNTYEMDKAQARLYAGAVVVIGNLPANTRTKKVGKDLVSVKALRRQKYEGEMMVPGNYYEMKPRDVAIYGTAVRVEDKPRTARAPKRKQVNETVDETVTKQEADAKKTPKRKRNRKK